MHLKWQQKGSITDNLYKLSINMVNYKYTDQPAAMKSLSRNEKLCWNEALSRNEYTNKLTDWYKYDCWLLKLENCWVWLDIFILFKKSLLYEHELQKPFQIAKFQCCKLVEDSSWFDIHWTASTVLENRMKSLGKQGFICTYFFFTKIVTAQSWPSRVSYY